MILAFHRRAQKGKKGSSYDVNFVDEELDLASETFLLDNSMYEEYWPSPSKGQKGQRRHEGKKGKGKCLGKYKGHKGTDAGPQSSDDSDGNYWGPCPYPGAEDRRQKGKKGNKGTKGGSHDETSFDWQLEPELPGYLLSEETCDDDEVCWSWPSKGQRGQKGKKGKKGKKGSSHNMSVADEELDFASETFLVEGLMYEEYWPSPSKGQKGQRGHEGKKGKDKCLGKYKGYKGADARSQSSDDSDGNDWGPYRDTVAYGGQKGQKGKMTMEGKGQKGKMMGAGMKGPKGKWRWRRGDEAGSARALTLALFV